MHKIEKRPKILFNIMHESIQYRLQSFVFYKGTFSIQKDFIWYVYANCCIVFYILTL